jgi:hypothetical protein
VSGNEHGSADQLLEALFRGSTYGLPNLSEELNDEELAKPVTLEVLPDAMHEMSHGSSPSFASKLVQAASHKLEKFKGWAAKMIQWNPHGSLDDDPQYRCACAAASIHELAGLRTIPILRGRVMLGFVERAKGYLAKWTRRATVPKADWVEVTAKPKLAGIHDAFPSREVARSPSSWTDAQRHMVAINMIIDEWLLGDRDAGVWQFKKHKLSDALFNSDVDSTFRVVGPENDEVLKDPRRASTLLFLDYAYKNKSWEKYKINWEVLEAFAKKVKSMDEARFKQLLAKNLDRESLYNTNTKMSERLPYPSFDALSEELCARKDKLVERLLAFKEVVDGKKGMRSRGLYEAERTLLRKAKGNIEIVDSDVGTWSRRRTQKRIEREYGVVPLPSTQQSAPSA